MADARNNTSAPHSMFFFTDREYSRLVHIDEQIQRLLGVSAELLTRHPSVVMALIHPADRSRFRASLEAAVTGEQLDEMVRPSRGPEWRRISIRASRSPAADGCVAGIVWDSSDRYDQLVELARRRDREVLLAARIQRSLLCDATPVRDHGFTVSGTTVPSQSVDGDFYALVSCYDGSIDVALGDVMGKGVGAALLAAGTRLGLLRATVNLLRFGTGERVPPTPAEIVGSAHRLVFADLYRLNRFVTLAYGRFDSRRARLSFVDCGNPPAVLYRPATGTTYYLKGHNYPLGLVREERPVVLDVPIERNDMVLYFSDGLSEAINESGEQFGIERIASFLDEYHGNGSGERGETVAQGGHRAQGDKRAPHGYRGQGDQRRQGDQSGQHRDQRDRATGGESAPVSPEHAYSDTDENDLISGLLDSVRAFSEVDGLGDDVSVIAVRYSSDDIPSTVKRRIMRITSDIAGLRKLPGFLRFGMRGVDSGQLESTDAVSLVLAVREVAVRVVNYCLSERADGIDVVQNCYDEWVSVELRYEGAPYDPQSHREDNIEAEMASRVLEHSRCSICYCDGPGAHSAVFVSLRFQD